MRKFADKLRNFSMTPSPDSQPTSGGPRRRHSVLSASAVQTTATSSTQDANTPNALASWAVPAPALSPEFAPQRLLSQFGASPQVASTAKKAHTGQGQEAHPAAGQLNSLLTAFAHVSRQHPTMSGCLNQDFRGYNLGFTSKVLVSSA